MVKRFCSFLLLLIFLMVFSFQPVYADGNESITGKLTQVPFTLAVQIVTSPVNLTLISPANGTYWSGSDIYLNYTATSNALHTWYSVDDGSNVTVSAPRNFSASPGSHTLRIYSNNSDGNLTSASVTFYVNTSSISINYSSFKGQGATTNLERYTLEELGEIDGLSMERVSYGSIRFNEEIDLLDTESIFNDTLNINNYVSIFADGIYVNTTALPNFNKPATLQLDNLGFSDPYILRDNEPCPSSVCVIQSYAGGSLIFNVTSFSLYSAAEGPAPSGSSSVPSSSSGGGGGGGGYIAPLKKIRLVTEEAIMSLKQGETKRSEIAVENLEKVPVNVTFEVVGLGDFILLPVYSLEIKPGQMRSMPFDVVVRENAYPDLYIRQIVVKEGGKEVGRMNVGIDVSSKQALFDVEVGIIDDTIRNDELLLAEISIYNLGETGRVDTEIEYVIKDIYNRNVYSSHETQAVETNLNAIKRIKLPEGLEDGRYILYVKTLYAGQTASASAWFTVGDQPLISTYAVAIIVLGAAVFAYLYFRRDSASTLIDKVESLANRTGKAVQREYASISSPVSRLISASEGKSAEREMERLKQQLKQLNYVHSQQLVDDSEYSRTRQEIEKKMRNARFRR